MDKPMRNHMVAAKLGENKRHRIGKKEGKKHSREEHHHSHTYE